MKKLFSLMATFLMMSGFLMPASALATTYTADQSCANVDVSHYENIADNTPHEQGFRPTQNRIRRVALKIAGMNVVGNTPIRLRLFAFGNPAVVAEKVTQPTATSPVIRVWEFDTDVTIVPGARYILRLEKMSGTGTPYWFTNGDSCYDRGAASKGGVVMGYDYDFKTYGYTYTTPESVPAPTEDPVSADGTTAATTTTTATTAYSNIVVDTSIAAPVLTAISKNGVTTKAPITEEISVGAKDKLILNGTSAAGVKVVLFVGDEAIEAPTATDGTWTAELDGSELSVGPFTIQGQSVKDTKGSTKSDLMDINVLAAKTATPEKADWISGWNIFFVLIPVGILLLVLLLLALIARRHHQEKLAGKPEKTKKEDAPVAEASEEPQIVKGKKSKNK